MNFILPVHLQGASKGLVLELVLLKHILQISVPTKLVLSQCIRSSLLSSILSIIAEFFILHSFTLRFNLPSFNISPCLNL
jgi:hypothetical protein